ncbi:NAD(P)-dependent dehydrogenase (short-subunit alcohol dehydrogenase family) [Pseudomonas nitritireducens]|uniref:3-oxoacyl-[acyl-carrier-protein] reductase FabG n=1 Tax=Pseudomonas nitroreducens TaxID=46680 RepID=A0A7W7P0C9_PSENT|nr:SDR family oxidoreductase [Pseudomonas nitritireducens]MBB4863663.1 NAD(P)-dependent dehydrogenase (short-subunit alcohol dehydrogenase family) [Pseudomonas nitritireducens]
MQPVMLITGASRGIGAATALLAAQRGYRVALNYRREREAAQALVEQITAAGGTAQAFAADVSVEEDVLRLFREVDQAFGRLDVLVNNAGILERQMRLEDMDVARLQRVFAVNVTGTFLCCREAVKRMARQHGGHGGSIVNVSSMASRLGSPNEYIDYAAAKGAVDSLTIGLAKEVAGEGIRVNAVRPGLIRTEIHASGGEPGRVERLQAAIPLGRGGEAEEVARAILFLASEESSYSTGGFIDVSGGR